MGSGGARGVSGADPNVPAPIQALLRVCACLDALGVTYAVGGSLASSVHGEFRATQDGDIVVALRREHAEPLVSALGPDFYADLAAMRRAIRDRSSVNLIHLDTMFKIDLFVAKDDPLEDAELRRRRRLAIIPGTEPTAFVMSAEDICLQKLRWFRMTGETSDRQWRDVKGILKRRRDDLDYAYLESMAKLLGLDDLLARAARECRE